MVFEQSEKSPMVSVIIPVFNEEKTVAVAIESVALQRTDFDVEILVVDDCSTDGTPVVLNALAEQYPNVQVLRNERNSGKGYSFKRAYDQSKGSYFHVLDGDDCFVCYEKLQRQVEFLEANRDYFAVGHNSLLSATDGVRLVSEELRQRDWSNADCLSGKVYCHTSSLLFRKIVDELPDYFLQPEFRGDTAIFFFSAYTTGHKCKYLPHVWSIYNFHGAGLWSSLKLDEQRAFNVKVVQALKDKIVQDPCSEAGRLLDDRMQRVLSARSTAERSSESSMEDLLLLAEHASSKVFVHREKAFNGMYGFRFVDEICEAAGRAWCLDAGVVSMERELDARHAILLVSGLVPGGGGVFREIKDLVQILLAEGFKVGIVSTQKIPTDEAIFHEHFDDENIWYWQASADASRSDRLNDTLSRLVAERAGVIFPFITHNDPVGSAAIQRPLGARIVFDFVYDHGLSLAVLNSSIDTIIVKTVSQARALNPMIPGANFSLIPPFFSDRFGRRDYVPMANGSLTTASAAARSYKVEGEYVYSYSKIVPELLKASGGTHIHYGPLSDETKDVIFAELGKLGVSEDRFRHIPWAEDFGGSLIAENVDLFVAPFPICSARIAIEVMACGIPSVNHLLENPGIPQSIDFIDPQQFVWREPRELFDLVSALDAPALSAKSRSARAFFEQNNCVENVAGKLFTLQRLVLSDEGAPEFVMSEFSEEFFVEARTPLFRDGIVKFPIDGEDGNADKFWHRTAARRFIRGKFHLFRNTVRGRSRSRKTPV